MNVIDELIVCLGVADVKISIWFGREPGVHLTLSEVTVCSKDLGGVPNVDIATNQF